MDVPHPSTSPRYVLGVRCRPLDSERGLGRPTPSLSNSLDFVPSSFNTPPVGEVSTKMSQPPTSRYSSEWKERGGLEDDPEGAGDRFGWVFGLPGPQHLTSGTSVRPVRRSRLPPTVHLSPRPPLSSSCVPERRAPAGKSYKKTFQITSGSELKNPLKIS